MLKNSNGRPADGSTTDPRGTYERAFNPPPPPVESQISTNFVPVRTTRTTLAHGRGKFDGWIDIGECTYIAQRKGRDRGWEFDWQALFLTPGGRFLVDVNVFLTIETNHPVEEYAIFITEREAAGWFADDPQTAPDWMRPLIKKFDLTEAPMMDATPDDLFDRLIRQSLRFATQFGRVQFATESYLKLIDQEDPDELPELAAAAPSGNGTAATNDQDIEAPDGSSPEVPDYVTLSQATKMVKKSKRTLEREKSKGTLPPPVVKGGGGRADLYDWAVMRLWLAERFGWNLDRLPLVHPETAALRARASADRRQPPTTADIFPSS